MGHTLKLLLSLLTYSWHILKRSSFPFCFFLPWYSSRTPISLWGGRDINVSLKRGKGAWVAQSCFLTCLIYFCVTLNQSRWIRGLHWFGHEREPQRERQSFKDKAAASTVVLCFSVQSEHTKKSQSSKRFPRSSWENSLVHHVAASTLLTCPPCPPAHKTCPPWKIILCITDYVCVFIHSPLSSTQIRWLCFLVTSFGKMQVFVYLYVFSMLKVMQIFGQVQAVVDLRKCSTIVGTFWKYSLFEY